jgi:hypothetical protein
VELTLLPVGMHLHAPRINVRDVEELADEALSAKRLFKEAHASGAEKKEAHASYNGASEGRGRERASKKERERERERERELRRVPSPQTGKREEMCTALSTTTARRRSGALTKLICVIAPIPPYVARCALNTTAVSSGQRCTAAYDSVLCCH